MAEQEVILSPENQNTAELSKADPYHLHHSDHPGVILVSKTLNGDNYPAWKRAMMLALNSKNKMGFIDGSCKPPSQENNPDSYGSWSRCNDMVHSWIINTLDPDIADSVIYYPTAHDVWEDLRERFSQGNAPRIFEIQQTIASLKQGQLSVSTYYTKLKSLWDELTIYSDSKETAPSEQQKLMQFLMGLNDTYAAIRSQILLQIPLPTVRQAYSSVTQAEKQIHISSENESVAAMAVKSNSENQTQTSSQSESVNKGRWSSYDANRGDGGRWSSRGGRSNLSGRWGGRHDQARGGGRFTNSGKGRPHCSHCNVLGHSNDTCWELHGYPPTHPKSKTNTYKSAYNISVTPGNEEGTVTLPRAHLEQLLSLLNNQETKSGATASPKANAVSKTGSGYEEDDWFG